MTTVSSARANVAYKADTSDRATLAATVTDDVTNEVTVELGSWLSAGPALGEWWIKIETTWADGSVRTFPASNGDTLLVVEQWDA